MAPASEVFEPVENVTSIEFVAALAKLVNRDEKVVEGIVILNLARKHCELDSLESFPSSWSIKRLESNDGDELSVIHEGNLYTSKLMDGMMGLQSVFADVESRWVGTACSQ